MIEISVQNMECSCICEGWRTFLLEKVIIENNKNNKHNFQTNTSENYAQN